MSDKTGPVLSAPKNEKVKAFESILFEFKIQIINMLIKSLEEDNRAQIRDDNDFAWCLDAIRYSPEQDEVLFTCKEVKKDL